MGWLDFSKKQSFLLKKRYYYKLKFYRKSGFQCRQVIQLTFCQSPFVLWWVFYLSRRCCWFCSLKGIATHFKNSVSELYYPCDAEIDSQSLQYVQNSSKGSLSFLAIRRTKTNLMINCQSCSKPQLSFFFQQTGSAFKQKANWFGNSCDKRGFENKQNYKKHKPETQEKINLHEKVRGKYTYLSRPY